MEAGTREGQSDGDAVGGWGGASCGLSILWWKRLDSIRLVCFGGVWRKFE